MKIAYFLNTYPSTSQTFIRREIRALEGQGVEIVRYAIRQWSEDLVNEEDLIEAAQTSYILNGSYAALFGNFLRELVTNPIGMCRAIATWCRLFANAGGGFVRHAAYLLEAVTLKRWASRDRVRLLHTHFATNAAAVALLCKKLGGPEYSFTAHGQDEFDDSRASLKEKVEEALFVATISNFCRVQIARLVGMSVWKKLHIVRCGLDMQEFPRSTASFDDNLTFVCVGRLCVQKAQTLVVEAVAKVQRNYPDIHVVFIGDGDARPELEAAVATFKIEKNVTILGWKSNAEVRQRLAAARALVLPSFAEGLPIVIMEAQALERPVITTFIGGIPELVDGNCGWIIPAGSVDDLCNALIEAIETPSQRLAQMGAEGRRRVIELYDIHRNTAILRNLFSSTENSRASPTREHKQC